MNYKMAKYVHASGFVETGISAIINDRDTSVSVPWEVSQAGGNQPKDVEWTIKSDNGYTYTVTIPITITYDSTTGKSTATYTKGTYTITAPQAGGT